MATAWLENNLRQLVAIREKRHYRLSLAVKAAYLILQQFDLALTVLAISLGFVEMNPWMRSLLNSPLQLVTVKLVIPLLIAWLVPYRLLIPACLFLMVVAGWNIRELAVVMW